MRRLSREQQLYCCANLSYRLSPYHRWVLCATCRFLLPRAIAVRRGTLALHSDKTMTMRVGPLANIRVGPQGPYRVRRAAVVCLYKARIRVLKLGVNKARISVHEVV
jgi:hypothetical protein